MIEHLTIDRRNTAEMAEVYFDEALALRLALKRANARIAELEAEKKEREEQDALFAEWSR